MKRVHSGILLILSMLLLSCKGEKQEPALEIIDTIPMIVTQIQKCSRLYTTEYRIHKIITHEDEMKLSGSFMKKDFNINIPAGERRIAIPMDATVKAYVDFGEFSKENLKRSGEQLTIFLPDPKIVLTSTRISHKEIKKYVALTRRSFSDEELSNYEQQGRKAIIDAIPQMNIAENARLHSANTIIPIIAAMGFEEKNITITFKGKDGNPTKLQVIKN